MKIAVSACLLGEACRYDGRSMPCAAMERLARLEGVEAVPVCPEVAGGLPTPRPASEIDVRLRAPRVTNAEGADVTAAFEAGAAAALARAQQEGCALAVLKSRSPSCGIRRVYDGTFSGTLAFGYGIAARAFRAAGIRVVDEDDLAGSFAAADARGAGSLPGLFAQTSASCPSLETERLVLCPLRADDAEDVLAYCSDPDIGADAGWPAHRTVADSLAFIEGAGALPHVFGVFEKTPDRDDGGVFRLEDSAAGMGAPALGSCIGSVGLIPDPHRENPDCLMLGYALAKRAWGRGLMTEAAREVIRYGFEELRLSLITATHYPFNVRSASVIRKCGLRPEGVLRAAALGEGGLPSDLALHSLSAEEWRRGRKPSSR